MNDGSRVFNALKKSLKGLFPKMTGHEASNFGTLLHLITGMVVSKHCHLPKVAGKVKSNIKQESQIKKFKRFLSNSKVNGNVYFLPFLEKLLPALITKDVKLLIDGSVVGNNSACLMASIVFKNRSIPIAWYMGEGKKGHFSELFHIELLKLVKNNLPEDVVVTVIGDGEFDGVTFLETIEEYGWHFVVRTAANSKFTKKGHSVMLPKKLNPGEHKSYDDVDFTNDYYGPIMVLLWRPDGGKTIITLISNHSSSLQVIQDYKKRQIIETFFSDLKTKGFHLQKSHISDLFRLGNLMVAACLGYIWVVLLGKYALDKGINEIFHKTERCDLSLLQLGFRYLEYLINNDLSLPKIDLRGLG